MINRRRDSSRRPGLRAAAVAAALASVSTAGPPQAAAPPDPAALTATHALVGMQRRVALVDARIRSELAEIEGRLASIERDLASLRAPAAAPAALGPLAPALESPPPDSFPMLLVSPALFDGLPAEVARLGPPAAVAGAPLGKVIADSWLRVCGVAFLLLVLGVPMACAVTARSLYPPARSAPLEGAATRTLIRTEAAAQTRQVDPPVRLEAATVIYPGGP